MLNLEEKPYSQHLREMAKHFNAVLEEGNDAMTITMDNSQAKGFISSYLIYKGLAVWVYNITFHNDFELRFDLSTDRSYYFNYSVRGHFFHQYGHKTFTKVLQNQNMIFKGGQDTTVQITFPEEINLEIAVIAVDLNQLAYLDIRNAKRMHSEIQEIFQNMPTDRPYRYLGDIDVQIEKYASIICAKNDVDLVGGLLTEGAVLNMLASQLTAYTQHGKAVDTPFLLTNSELSQVTTIKAYVVEHLATNITIKDLSAFTGLSPKKMQAGAKHLYGTTIGHFILNLRMKHAKLLFLTTELNVSEVCHKVGISSQSYFAKVFKEKFGVSPSVFRKNSLSPR